MLFSSSDSLHSLYTLFNRKGFFIYLVNLTDLELRSTGISRLDVSLLPISLRKLCLSECVDWATFVPTILSRLTRLRELTLGCADSLGTNTISLAKMTPDKALERIYYTRSTCSTDNDYNYLCFVPSHIELIKY